MVRLHRERAAGGHQDRCGADVRRDSAALPTHAVSGVAVTVRMLSFQRQQARAEQPVLFSVQDARLVRTW